MSESSSTKLWKKIGALKAKRTKNGRVIKPISKQEQNLRKQAEKYRGKTPKGKKISMARKKSAAAKKAVKNSQVKNKRTITMKKLYKRYQ